MPDDVARQLRGWSRTINRWAMTRGERCYLVTEQAFRPASPDDVAEAVERLRRQRRPGAT